MAAGQELSYWASNDVSSIELIKGDITRGANLAWQYELIKCSLSKDLRKAYYDKNGYSEEERKVIDKKLVELASVATQFNISLESIAAAQVFANDPGKKQVYEEIHQVLGKLKNFDPAKNAYYVPAGRENILLIAVSAKERTKWAHSFFSASEEGKELFFEKLDEVSALAGKVIPKLKPNLQNFKIQDESANVLLKSKIIDSKVKIFKLGLANAYESWEIQYDETKLNPKEYPQKRFKKGFAWIKDPANDFSYCELVQINLIQDYLGNGKYSNTKAVVIERAIFGCPAE